MNPRVTPRNTLWVYAGFAHLVLITLIVRVQDATSFLHFATAITLASALLWWRMSPRIAVAFLIVSFVLFFFFGLFM